MEKRSRNGLDVRDETSNSKSSDNDGPALNSETLVEQLDDALIEQLDRALIDTTCKRRNYPVIIKRNLAQEYNSSLDLLAQTKFHLSGAEELKEGHSASELCPLFFHKSTEEKLDSAFSTLSLLSKSSSLAVDRAERLEKSYRMCATLAACSTQRIVHHPDPEEDKMAASVTPLRRRREYPYRTPPGKIKQSKINNQKCVPKIQLLNGHCTELLSTQRRSTRLKDNL